MTRKNSKTIKLPIPKNYKLLVMTVGDEHHPQTEKNIAEMRDRLMEAVDKKKTCIVVPHWISLKVVK